MVAYAPCRRPFGMHIHWEKRNAEASKTQLAHAFNVALPKLIDRSSDLPPKDTKRRKKMKKVTPFHSFHTALQHTNLNIGPT
jgi:hypothetical protein